MVASSADVKTSSRLGLLRRSPSFGYLFLATAGSSFGTYLAAIALILQIRDLTGSGVWVAALLIADFLPIVVDRLPPWTSRRPALAAMAHDRVRPRALRRVRGAAVRRQPGGDRWCLPAFTGVATGFFFPAANAAIPNLVPEDELANANSLPVTVDTLAMTLGPLLAARCCTRPGAPSVPYAVNAVTFLVSAAFVVRIPRAEPPLRGSAHARPLARRCRRS